MIITKALKESSLNHYLRMIKLNKYNRKNGTNLQSEYASFKAIYGRNVLISKGTHIADDVQIGDYSYVNTNSFLENCIIGKFCSISSGVYISPWEHSLNFRTTHPVAYDNKFKSKKRMKVVIGNDVLISLNCIILEGITIGNGAVIGAGAVVTKNVLPYEIVGGVPAKHIAFRFNEEEISSLEEIAWWDWDIQKVKNNLEFLQNKTNYIKEE